MKKVLALLVVVLYSTTLFAQMAKYERKSISITKMSVAPMAKTLTTQEDVKFVYDEVYKGLKSMERFDYNEIPAGVSDINELMKIVKEYTATKIEERAAKQWNIKNEYYGSNFVTGENVDKIMNGSYIITPSLESFAIVKGKDSEGKESYAMTLNVKLAVYEGVQNQEGYSAKLIHTINASGTNVGLGSILALGKLSLTEKDPRIEAREQAVNAMLIFLEKEVRKLPIFTIKAFTTKVNPAKDEINFNMGKNVGVKMDDTYQVGFYEGEKFVETGFMKVRKINKEDSKSQLLIVTNPKKEKESELFNEFDQVIEYPQVGLNIIVGGGMVGFKGWDDVDNADVIVKSIMNNWAEEKYYSEYKKVLNDKESNSAMGFGLKAEYNLAKFTNISELYASISAEMISPELGIIKSFHSVVNTAKDTVRLYDSKVEISAAARMIEVGLKKKIYKRKASFVLGVDFGYALVDYENNYVVPALEINDKYEAKNNYTYGVHLNLGMNYLFTKNLFLDLNAGYRMYGELIRGEDDAKYNHKAGDEFFKDDKAFGGQGYLTPSGLVLKAGIGFTL